MNENTFILTHISQWVINYNTIMTEANMSEFHELPANNQEIILHNATQEAKYLWSKLPEYLKS